MLSEKDRSLIVPRKVDFMVSLKSYRIQLSSTSCNYKSIMNFLENGSIRYALYLLHDMFGGRGFHGLYLLRFEILATHSHLQTNIKMIRRYEGWYYTRLYNILF